MHARKAPAAPDGHPCRRAKSTKSRSSVPPSTCSAPLAAGWRPRPAEAGTQRPPTQPLGLRCQRREAISTLTGTRAHFWNPFDRWFPKQEQLHFWNPPTAGFPNKRNLIFGTIRRLGSQRRATSCLEPSDRWVPKLEQLHSWNPPTAGFRNKRSFIFWTPPDRWLPGQ